jgi:hypothetical protein
MQVSDGCGIIFNPLFAKKNGCGTMADTVGIIIKKTLCTGLLSDISTSFECTKNV